MNPWGNKPRPVTDAQVDAIKAWSREVPRPAIAVLRQRLDALGLPLSPRALYNLLRRMHNEKTIQRRVKKAAREPMMNVEGSQRRAGSIVQHLPPGIAAWLRKQVPDGGDLLETLAAIVTDAYHDERGE